MSAPDNLAQLKLSKKEEDLFESGLAISQNHATIEEATYIHSVLCQVGLPRSKVDGITFERRCGEATLLIQAGKIWNGEMFVQQCVPYGPLPRLILAYINQFAILHKTPEIPIGDCPSEFLRMLGKHVSGGEKGTIHNFKKQLHALVACSLTLGYNAGGCAHTCNSTLIKHYEAWTGAGENRTLWPGKFVLSSEYFDSLMDKRAVPIDFRAYTALRYSSLAMDAYSWLASRLFRMKNGKLFLRWINLREQFGQEYQGKYSDKDFKKAFKKALTDVQAVYPFARIEVKTTGILLLQSHPPIPCV